MYVLRHFGVFGPLIESKEAFQVAKFLRGSVCKDKDMDFKKTMEQFKDFKYKFQRSSKGF